MTLKAINPSDMAQPRGYSQAVAAAGHRTTVYIGGQDAVDANGKIVGPGSLKAQTEQILSNIEKILRDAQGQFEHIVKLNIYLLAGQNPADGFQAFQQKWGQGKTLPAITVVFVAGLGNPDWLVEIDAVAEIPTAD